MSVARDYYNSGVGHCNVAALTHAELHRRGWDRTEATWVALQNNIGFAAENALKAYLASAGVPVDDLKQTFGHNLGALFAEACRLGLSDDARSWGNGSVSMLGELISRIGPGYQSFAYRYLNSESVFVLHEGQSTENAIAVLRDLLDSAESKIAAAEVLTASVPCP